MFLWDLYLLCSLWNKIVRKLSGEVLEVAGSGVWMWFCFYSFINYLAKYVVCFYYLVLCWGGAVVFCALIRFNLLLNVFFFLLRVKDSSLVHYFCPCFIFAECSLCVVFKYRNIHQNKTHQSQHFKLSLVHRYFI